MNANELREWLESREEIMSFTDYEPYFESDDEFITTLGYWFNNQEWNDQKYTFVNLGADGTGSQFAAWKRPDSDVTPIVMFGSEGGRGVLTTTPENFALALSYGVSVEEYDFDNDMDGPAKLTEGNWLLEEPDDEIDPREQLKIYQAAAAKRFGKIPPFEELTSGLDELNKEFMAWVESRVGE